MTDSIDYRDWQGIKAFYAKLADLNHDGKLEKTDKYDEISIFNQQYSKVVGINDEITSDITARRDATNYEQFIVDPNPIVSTPDIKSQVDNFVQKSEDYSRVEKMISNEAQKRGVAIENIDIDYWTEKISNISQKYNIPEALLIAIIGQETNGKFTKQSDSNTGAGPMQITGISVKDFFPSKQNGWYDIYKSMNEELLNDILYKRDKNGNFLKDRKGDYILKYPTYKALRNACAQDDELGIKVGLLCFEMKYVKAVAQNEYGKATYANIPDVIDGIKSGEITLSEADNKGAIKTALKNYNSVFTTYATTVVDSLAQHGLDFEGVYFIK